MPTQTDTFIDGSDSAKVQLRVQGASGQTEALQTWEVDATSPPSTGALARVTKDGNFQIGNVDTTADAFLEVQRDDENYTNSARPKRGIHSFGKIAIALSETLVWAVHELELIGNVAISSLQTAFRAKVTNRNTGNLTGAEFRAGDFEAINQGGTSASTGKYTGLRATATNAASKQANKLVAVEAAISNGTGGTVTEAVGFEVVSPVNNGTITTIYGLKIPALGSSHYAIQTGTGKVDFGDLVSVASFKLAASAGTNKLLTSDASGNASWQVAAINNRIAEGRLTLTTATPVTTSDVTAATTLYFTPFNGNRVALYDGSAWILYTFTERSLSLSGLTASTNYDVFLYDNSGTLTLEAVAWSNNTTRTTALVLQDGVQVKSGALTRRYLGTFRTLATGQTEDSKLKRFVWNLVYQVPRVLRVNEVTDAWSYNSATWRPVNNNNANKVEFVLGLGNVLVEADAVLQVNSWSSAAGTTGIGVDSTSANSAAMYNEGVNTLSTAVRLPALAKYADFPGLGYHYLQWLEYARVGTVSFEGDAGIPAAIQSGMMGRLWA